MAFRDFTPSMCKAMSLTPFNLPPSGWETVGYDDSGWATAVDPVVSGTDLKNATQIPATIYNDTIPVDGPLPIWTTSTPTAANIWGVFRLHFNLPANYTVTDIPFWGPPDWTGLFETQVYINGIFSSGFLGVTAANMNGTMHTRGVTGDNVLAILIWEHNGAPTWGATAWWTARIAMTVAATARSYALVIG